MEVIELNEDKKYIRAFVGIPLPRSYEEKLERLLTDLARLDPELILVNRKTAHILLVFLGNRSGRDLLSFCQKIEMVVASPAMPLIKVKGGGVFQNKFRTVIYLAVAGDQLSKLAEDIGQIEKSEEGKFLPHLTLARKKGRWDLSAEVAARLAAEEWDFAAEEMALYGAVSVDGKMVQKKLVSWRL